MLTALTVTRHDNRPLKARAHCCASSTVPLRYNTNALSVAICRRSVPSNRLIIQCVGTPCTVPRGFPARPSIKLIATMKIMRFACSSP